MASAPAVGSGVPWPSDSGFPLAFSARTSWVSGARHDRPLAYGHDRVSTCLKRDVVAWQQHLTEEALAPATVNNHLAALSAFTSWVGAHAPRLFPFGDPAKGVGELGLPPLEPRALSDGQVRSLKSVCDRLPKLAAKRGRRWQGKDVAVHARRRPWRDRAIFFVLLSTGLRREELITLDLDQLQPSTAPELRAARRATIAGVRGKGKSQRTVFLSADARPMPARRSRTTSTTSATATPPRVQRRSSSRQPGYQLGRAMAGCRHGPSISSWSSLAAGTMPRSRTQRGVSRPCGPMTCAIPLLSSSLASPAPTPMSSNGAWATAPSGIFSAIPTRRKPSPPATLSTCSGAQDGA